MGINIGNKKITDIKLGNKQIKKVYKGSNLIWAYTPPPVIYGVEVDYNNSNPETSVSYTDDAIGMAGGSSDWDLTPIFKDIRPCLLKNGVVQYYLNPNDFTKKAEGGNADITSGDDGDVMIEIPRMGYYIETDGDKLIVKITDAKNDPNFCYYAHTRDNEGDRDNLYIGAYHGWKDADNKLRSLSAKSPTASQTIGTFRTQAQANGTGYDLLAFYPLTLLQVLYLIKYKNLNSQVALGHGWTGESAKTNTGGTNTKGMFYGNPTGGKDRMKFAGIEDFWGNVRNWIDGLYSDGSRNILTAFRDFNDNGTGYENRGAGGSGGSGNVKTVQGDNGRGFIPETFVGTTNQDYFCDYGNLSASCFLFFGGNWNNGSYAGAFNLQVDYSAASSDARIGGRIMFL
jgi:hypothetical protein